MKKNYLLYGGTSSKIVYRVRARLFTSRNMRELTHPAQRPVHDTVYNIYTSKYRENYNNLPIAEIECGSDSFDKIWFFNYVYYTQWHSQDLCTGGGCNK